VRGSTVISAPVGGNKIPEDELLLDEEELLEDELLLDDELLEEELLLEDELLEELLEDELLDEDAVSAGPLQAHNNRLTNRALDLIIFNIFIPLAFTAAH
jgi:hypothetical protein